MQKESLRLTRAQAGLVVVDVQERLLPAIFEKERVVQNAVRLIQGAGVLRVPVFATEQYRKGLGPTVPEEVFDAVAVAGERIGPVTAVHGAVQLLMRLKQRRR